MKHITKQSTSAVFMVQPRSFGFDDQTAKTNSFQTKVLLTRGEVLRRANNEFDLVVDGLRSRGIFVQVYLGGEVKKPSAVFPNNWLSTWPDGSIYLYPMATKSRRLERHQDGINELAQQFKVGDVFDLSNTENHEQYLESTGVIIFDHVHKVMYGCISQRCNQQLFYEHAKVLGYRPVVFHAYDAAGAPIYHTNVMMGIQTNTVVICADAIPDEDERAMVLASLRTGHRIVVEITYAQMTAFCGNVLELRNGSGEQILAMSQSAHDNFTASQRRLLAKDKTLVPFAIPTIEMIGGGSVRCMLAEVFLPIK
jgi:hypothetical protein